MTISPLMSVVIPTYNRASLLEVALQSFTTQTIPADCFEIVVIDDGSSDETQRVCDRFASLLPLHSFQIEHSGTAAAKNLGIFASGGALVLIFDDDDYASADLLQRHIEGHVRHPEENVAILGYTTWSPTLHVSELMHYVTEVGQYLFSYRNLRDGQVLDFTHFWAGRISCKRTFLVRNAVFNQDLHWPSYEDIELGYRLSSHGLRIIFNREAVSYMNRPLSYEDFLRRCYGQGASQWLVGQFHDDPVIDVHCRLPNAEAEWESVRHTVANQVDRVHQLEADLATAIHADEEPLRLELYRLYAATFKACRLKGFVEASERGLESVPA